MQTTPYLHVINGRMRIKLPYMKGAPQQAQAIERRLGDAAGVTQARANVRTGNVLIHFDTERITPDAILTLLGVKPQSGIDGEPVRSRNSGLNGRKVGEIILTKTVEIAAERLILAVLF